MNNILQHLLNDKSQYIYGTLGIANHDINSTAGHRFWFNHLRDKHLELDGDVYEFGVYKGYTLISIAILLKKIGSNKRVYGFDSFAGLNNYSDEDKFINFKKHENKIFEKSLVEKSILAKSLKEIVSRNTVNSKNISTSGQFDDANYEELLEKINSLGLDNITIIKGDFEDTIQDFFSEKKRTIFSANIDCDLYRGYKTCLPIVTDNLAPGGYIHLDEYYSIKFPGARIACNEFFNNYSSNDLNLGKEDTPKSEFERWFIKKTV